MRIISGRPEGGQSGEREPAGIKVDPGQDQMRPSHSGMPSRDGSAKRRVGASRSERRRASRCSSARVWSVPKEGRKPIHGGPGANARGKTWRTSIFREETSERPICGGRGSKMPGSWRGMKETRLECAILIDAVVLTLGRSGRHHRRDHTASYLVGIGDQLIQPGKPRLDMGYAPWAMSPPAAERRLRNHNLI